MLVSLQETQESHYHSKVSFLPQLKTPGHSQLTLSFWSLAFQVHFDSFWQFLSLLITWPGDHQGYHYNYTQYFLSLSQSILLHFFAKKELRCFAISWSLTGGLFSKRNEWVTVIFTRKRVKVRMMMRFQWWMPIMLAVMTQWLSFSTR